MFSVVSVCQRGLGLGSHVTITHDAMDLMTQGPLHAGPQPCSPLYRTCPIAKQSSKPILVAQEGMAAAENLDIGLCMCPVHLYLKLCSGWTSLYRDPTPPDMFILVHYEAHTVGKWTISILLECFLVTLSL